VYLLLPGKIAAVVMQYADRQDVPCLEALERCYASETYKKLEQESAKYWHLGPGPVMRIFAVVADFSLPLATFSDLLTSIRKTA